LCVRVRTWTVICRHVLLQMTRYRPYGALLALALAAQVGGQQTAHIKIDTDRVIGDVDPHLFGNFAEHLGRCIYGGIWDEGSPFADADGYRKDVKKR
jgi:hypothetical protein